MIKIAKKTKNEEVLLDNTSNEPLRAQQDDFSYAAPKLENHTVNEVEVKTSWLGRSIGEPKLDNSIILSSLVINLFALATPLMILQVYDRIIPNQSSATLWILFLSVCTIIGVDLVLKSARNYALGYSASNYTHNMGVEAVNRILNAPYGTVEKQALSTHINRLNSLMAVGDYHSSQTRTTAIDMPFVVIFLALMTLVGGALVLVPLVLFALFGLFSISQNRQMNAVLDERTRIDNRKYDFIIEALSGIFTVKALSMESPMQRRYERLQQNCAESTHKQVMLSNKIQDVSVFFGSVAQVAVVSVGASMVISNYMSIGALACCTLLSGQILQPLLRGIVVWSDYQNLALRRKDATQLFNYPEVSDASEISALNGDIILNDLTAMNAKQIVLNSANYTFKGNKITGIYAPNDGQRHAFLRVLRGDLLPQTGFVQLSGYEPLNSEFASARKKIGYCASNSQLFRGSILENLTNFEINGKRSAALEAVRLVGIEDEINQLPDGFDSRVAESSMNEYGAQFVQRLLFARALVAMPDILILDNITDGFDAQALQQFKRTLDVLRGRMTVILASSDSRILSACDEFCALVVEGQIKEAKFGTQTSSTKKSA